ncbi:MAG: DUF2934 domain-containing protein [Sulfuricellaceae bacterium]|nr:DUF2934 domain-containing protein [Sulfuricellaceae bacterium]
MAEAKTATASKTVKPATAATPASANPVAAKPAATRAPAAKPAAAKKTTEKEAAPAKKAAAPKKAAAKMTVTLEQRYKMICDAAYFKAEKRGFSPENETQDWLDAEAEINKLLGM